MKNLTQFSKHEPGFALVSTIILMVLLVLIAVSLLSLSAINTRTRQLSSAQEEAQANARLALMLAIGELHEHAGKDTRITASSLLLDPDYPPVLGVWSSWEGSDHDSTGKPYSPDYDDKPVLSWLVSSSRGQVDPADIASWVFDAGSTDTVPLLGPGTLGADASGQIHVVPEKINDSGNMAWWISGENQKARLPAHYEPTQDTAAGWSKLAKSYGVPDTEPFGLDPLLAEPSLAAMAFTRGTTDLITLDPAPVTQPREFFHDLSVSSVGLLTNSATGGWRKDMSLMTELWDSLPNSDLPFFRISSSSTTNVAKPTPSNPTATQSMLYPWSDYPGSAEFNRSANTRNGAVSSWLNLKNYALSYKNANPSGSNYTIPYISHDVTSFSPSGLYDFVHTVPTIPVVARIQWVFSHLTSQRTVDGEPKYELRLVVNPVVTLWNPYNTAISCPDDIRLNFPKSPPWVIRYHYKDDSGAERQSVYKKFFTGASDDNSSTGIGPDPTAADGGYDPIWNVTEIGCVIKQEDLVFKPGETLVFSPASNTKVNPNFTGDATLDMALGYSQGGGYVINTRNNAGFNIGYLDPEDPVKVDFKFNNPITAYQSPAGVKNIRTGFWFEAFHSNKRIMLYYVYVDPSKASDLWPDIPSGDIASEIAEAYSGNATPFFSYTFGSRISTDSEYPAKGVIQTNPMLNSAQIGRGGLGGFTGAGHPVNASYDYGFITHTPAGDNKLPNSNTLNNNGYIVTGHQSGDGLFRVIMSEFPLRPMTSLVELQNWNLRGSNRHPPYQLYILGNSDASPLFAPNSAYYSYNEFQHDDSYCANHLLFDDWFFSSIAPDPTSFGSVINRDIRTVYDDFLAGTQPLPNRNYRAISEDMGLSASDRSDLVDSVFGSSDSWQRIASRFEVDGMFNVNSVSVTAWRALLGHCRNQKMPYHGATGMTTSAKTDYSASRFSVAGDVQTGEAAVSGEYIDASEVTGYRVFTDDMLDILAEKIVEQVRLRGPFLSLSEFVNRQLSSGDLALAGAVQTALNQLSEEASTDASLTDPFETLKGLSDDTGFAPGQEPADAGYDFPEASIGNTLYGLPGWTRQADILRPIAPILTVRDDTFTIRAYGDAVDDTGAVVSRAWCEATVQRSRDYVDPRDEADTSEMPVQLSNQKFGRRFKITSFRWLSADEV